MTTPYVYNFYNVSLSMMVALVTLGVLSFAWKENPVWRFVEQLIVGGAVGHYSVLAIRVIFYEGILQSAAKIDLLIGVLLGAVLFLRFFDKTRWIAAIPMAMTLGVSTALAMRELTANEWVQIATVVTPSLVGKDALTTIGLILAFLGAICALIYFTYYIKPVGIAKYVVGWPVQLGRFFFLLFIITQFATFSYTRFAMLMGAVLAIVNPPELYAIPVACVLVAIAIIWGRMKKRQVIQEPAQSPR